MPGCVANGVPAEVADEIYSEMTDFAKYAFNKSHAAAYGVVAYETAWLRCHYPVEFMAAMMTSVIDFPAKLVGYIQSLKEMNIELLPPNINESRDVFSVERSADGVKRIRFALSAVKNVGHSCIETLETERAKNGRFTDLFDFCRRMQDSDLNKRTLENLVKAGAFDVWGGRRSQYYAIYADALAAGVAWKKSQMSGQMDLFGLGGDDDAPVISQTPLPNVPEYPDGVKLALEKEALGIYLSGHPLAQYEEVWRRNVTNFTTDLAYESAEEAAEDDLAGRKVGDGEVITLGGIITSVTTKTTKNNNLMAFITLEDLYGSVEVLVFPNIFEDKREMFKEDSPVFIKGRVSVAEEEDSKLIAQTVADFDHPEELANNSFQHRKPIEPKTLWIQCASEADWDAKKEAILGIIKEDAGPYPVKIYLRDEKARINAPRRYNTWGRPSTRARIGKIVGETNVILK